MQHALQAHEKGPGFKQQDVFRPLIRPTADNVPGSRIQHVMVDLLEIRIGLQIISAKRAEVFKKLLRRGILLQGAGSCLPMLPVLLTLALTHAAISSDGLAWQAAQANAKPLLARVRCDRNFIPRTLPVRN